MFNVELCTLYTVQQSSDGDPLSLAAELMQKFGKISRFVIHQLGNRMLVSPGFLAEEWMHWDRHEVREWSQVPSKGEADLKNGLDHTATQRTSEMQPAKQNSKHWNSKVSDMRKLQAPEPEGISK